jgi:hypothetical protein
MGWREAPGAQRLPGIFPLISAFRVPLRVPYRRPATGVLGTGSLPSKAFILTTGGGSMSGARKLVLWALAVASTAACSDSGTIATAPDARLLMSAHAGATIDVSGEWLWSREEMLSFPAWVAEDIFGIEPEGPTTHARCTGTGTLTLEQVGGTFSGVGQGTDGECITSGGQVFSGAAPGAPRPVFDGKIHGRSLEWQELSAGGSVACSMHAVISEFDGTTAVALSGGGPCVVPGHPQSMIPLDPPPGGHQTVLSWSATRP